MKKKDLLVIGAALAIALVMLAVSRLLPKTSIENKAAQITMAPDAVEYLDATAAPIIEATDKPASEMTAEATAEPAVVVGPQMGPMPPAKSEKIGGHVLIMVGGRQYGDPIPMDRDKIITIRQESGAINKVHITPDSAYMEYSTCENQDCVGQGHITLENYKTRILSTFVICLPNNVSIEMIPADE